MRAQKAKAQAFPGVGRGPTGVIKSILDTSRTGGQAREEIFVDIVEKISATFSGGGHLQTSQIDGAIQARGSFPSCSIPGDRAWPSRPAGAITKHAGQLYLANLPKQASAEQPSIKNVGQPCDDNLAEQGASQTLTQHMTSQAPPGGRGTARDGHACGARRR